jgi:glutathione S-transferase
MKLYYAPGSCSLCAHIAARELALLFTLVKFDFRTRKSEDGRDYAAINPKGKVPALELDDGNILTELPAILQYLADRRPDAGLLPRVGTLPRYRVGEWVGYLNSEVHKLFGLLFMPGVSETQKDEARASVLERLRFMEKHLDGKSYVVAESYTVADIYTFVVLSWVHRLRFDLQGMPNLRAFYERIGARPAVLEARQAEGLA